MQQAIQPFTLEVQVEFCRWIQGSEYTNRAGVALEKHSLLLMFLRTSELRLNKKIEADIRTQVHGYRLDMDPSAILYGDYMIVGIQGIERSHLKTLHLLP